MLLGEGNSKLRTVVAALRLYTAYMTEVLRKPALLPPEKVELIACSMAFRNAGTYNNYVSALRAACQIAKVPTGSLYGPEILKASAEIAKEVFVLQHSKPSEQERARGWWKAGVGVVFVVVLLPPPCAFRGTANHHWH